LGSAIAPLLKNKELMTRKGAKKRGVIRIIKHLMNSCLWILKPHQIDAYIQKMHQTDAVREDWSNAIPLKPVDT
jgi:hypothetical protein